MNVWRAEEYIGNNVAESFCRKFYKILENSSFSKLLMSESVARLSVNYCINIKEEKTFKKFSKCNLSRDLVYNKTS